MTRSCWEAPEISAPMPRNNARPPGEEERDHGDDRQERERRAQPVQASLLVHVQDGLRRLRVDARPAAAPTRAGRRRRRGCRPRAARSLATTLRGTSGFCAIPVRNDAVSAATRTEPASAVPSEAPNCVAVFWRPPTSGLCSSGTAETVTLPSCEARPPMPRPISSSGMVTIWRWRPRPWR